MHVSYNWLSSLVDLSSAGGPEKVAELLTRRGIEVEEIHRQGHGLEGVVTAQILERKKHPEADRLSVCKVSLGSGDPLEIVCGAPNCDTGSKVALAQVGASLPNGLTIAAGKIRGVVSNGMLCSEEELKFKDKSEGILILPSSTALGKPLAQVLGKDDTILVLKLTSNRGDCLSHFGLARELASALGVKAKRPEAKLLEFTKTPISISLNAGDKAPQFYGCSIEDVKIGPSPEWLVKRLEAVGSRSINNVVDASNYVMLELGHPTHAYDATQIKGSKIQVRSAQKGETLPLLDGATITLAGDELVIADAERAVGLAGVMGGGNSEVRTGQAGTTKLFLECAEFHPGTVRKASTRYLRKTDAAHRFERGIDPRNLPFVISRLAQLITELAGGKVIGASFAGKPLRIQPEIRVEPQYFSDFLGMKTAAEKAEGVLRSLDCEVKKSGKELVVVPPSYRLDLGNREDLAEEVARSVGYDLIDETVPVLTSAPKSLHESSSDARLAQLDAAKDHLVASGLNETINFAFTSKAWLSKFGMSSSAALVNPLSEEYEALTPSLLPGLIQNALNNWNHHFGSESLAIRLFEIRPTFHAEGPAKAEGEMATNVREKWKLGIVMSGPRFGGGLRAEQGEVDFYDLKAVLESLVNATGARGVRFLPMSASRAPNPLFHPGQSSEVFAGKDVAGHFGLLHPGLAKVLKARAPVWLAEIDWDAVSKLARQAFEVPTFKAWSQFPAIERDFALLVPETVSAEKILSVALKAGKPLAKSARVFDVYRGAQVVKGMTSVAIRVNFAEETRSLQESEAEAASAQILGALKKELGIDLRA